MYTTAFEKRSDLAKCSHAAIITPLYMYTTAFEKRSHLTKMFTAVVNLDYILVHVHNSI